MKFTKENLLKELDNKPVVIWGARMTGIGFSHFVKRHNLNALCFVDSDQNLVGRNFNGLEILHPSEIPNLKEQYNDLKVIIAASLKEDEISRNLDKLGFEESEYFRYSKYCSGTFYTIDVAGTCNLKCPSCARSIEDMTSPLGFMPLNDFKKVTEKMVNETGLVSHVSLYSWGEPFMHPDMPKIIKHTHDLGIAAAVSTNLSIESQNQIRDIIKASPDYLKISLSGYYKETYDQTHTKGDVNLVKSNLYKLRHFIDKYHASVFVEVNYHKYKHNNGIDREKMKELCEELDFIFCDIYANITPVERLIDYYEGNGDKVTKELSELVLVSPEEAIEITKESHHLPCRFLENQVNINWDRTVPVCCVVFDRDADTIVSNDYLEQSLDEINQKKQGHHMCKKCMHYGIPSYLLSVNQKGWDEAAAKHPKRDPSKKN
jgi:MoaA/NifB/PqqE/SkfB family radical SAM enzyme